MFVFSKQHEKLLYIIIKGENAGIMPDCNTALSNQLHLVTFYRVKIGLEKMVD